MALFRSSERTTPASNDGSVVEPEAMAVPVRAGRVEAAPTEQATDPATTQTTRKGQTPKKGRPTLSREQAHAERMERLHPTLTRKQQRQVSAAARRRDNLARLDRQEASPERTLLRDHIDAKFLVTEYMIPVALLLVIASMVTVTSATAQYVISVLMTLFVITWIVTVVVVWRGYKKLARQRIDNPNFRGLLMYALNRMMLFRRFRTPAPRIKRGEQY